MSKAEIQTALDEIEDVVLPAVNSLAGISRANGLENEFVNILEAIMVLAQELEEEL